MRTGSDERTAAAAKSQRAGPIPSACASFDSAPYEERTLGRMAAMLTEDEVDEFRVRIDALFEEFRSRRTGRDTKQWALFIAMHPSRQQGTDPDV